MTIPETLAEMRHLMQRKTILQDRLERAQSAATSSGGIGDGMPRGNAQEPKLEHYGLYIVELTTKINNIDQMLGLYASDIAPVLSRVGDPRDAEILRKRYIDRQPASQIAREMRYNRTALLKIIRKAEESWLS